MQAPIPAEKPARRNPKHGARVRRHRRSRHACRGHRRRGDTLADREPDVSGEYQNLWGQVAMASSVRDRIHRLPDQKITLTHLPAQLCTPHFLVLPPVTGPRLKSCPCQSATRGSFSPLTGLFTEHVAPEMLYLETKWASLVPFGITVELLRDVLPVGTTLNAETVRNHLQRVATRMEGALGGERTSWIEDCPPDPARLPLPEGPVVVGIDGGYVRARERGRAHRDTNFEVVVGQSIAEDRDSRYFGLVQSFDDKPKRRLHEVLREQGLQMNQDITFLTDGGDTVRNLAADMSPCAEHVLDWFHLPMRLTVLGRYAKGLAHHDEEEAQAAERELKRTKGYLWNGNHRDALTCIDGLVDDLEGLPTAYAGIKVRIPQGRRRISHLRQAQRRHHPELRRAVSPWRAGLDGLRGVHRQCGCRKALRETPADALVKAGSAPDASDPNASAGRHAQGEVPELVSRSLPRADPRSLRT